MAKCVSINANRLENVWELEGWAESTKLVWCIVVLVLTSRHLHSKSSFCRFPHGSAHGLFPFYLFQHHFREFEKVACIRQQILVAFGQAPVDRTAHAPVSDSLNLKADQRYMVSQTVLAGAGFWSSNTF